MTDCNELLDFKGYVREDGSATIHGRLTAQDRDRTLLTSSDIASISYSIYEKNNTSVVIADSVPLVIGDVIESEDSYGDNFHYAFPSTSFPKGDRTYRVVLTVVSTTGIQTKAVGDLYAIETGTGTSN